MKSLWNPILTGLLNSISKVVTPFSVPKLPRIPPVSDLSEMLEVRDCIPILIYQNFSAKIVFTHKVGKFYA